VDAAGEFLARESVEKEAQVVQIVAVAHRTQSALSPLGLPMEERRPGGHELA
jgi:hypothetical protein